MNVFETSAAEQRPRRSLAWVAWLGIGVLGIGAVLAALLLLPGDGPDAERAKADVEALAATIATYVEDTGELPRVTVEPDQSDGGYALWGPDFLVEDVRVPRADPDVAALFTLVGDADSWCIERRYDKPATATDDAPYGFASVEGTGGSAGGSRTTPCGGDYAIHLAPASAPFTPAPGEIIHVWEAPESLCLVHPFSGDTPAGVVDETHRVEVADCNGPHGAEVVDAGLAAGNGVAAAEDQAYATCAGAYESVIGVPGNISSLTIEAFLAPTAQVAEDGEDGADGPSTQIPFVCLAFRGADDYALIGTVRDSWL